MVTPVSHVSPARSVGPAAAVVCLATAAVAAVATGIAGRVLDRWPPSGPDRWTRTNHAGARVTLLEGPQVVLGSGIAATVVGAPVAAFATLAAGGLGALDDLAGDASSKGLRGHLGALRRGRITTGAVKILGLVGAGAVVAVARARIESGPPGGSVEGSGGVGRLRLLAQVLVDTGVVAGSANLVNLLDLRPGRALKATLLLATPLALSGSGPASVAVGSALAALPRDLAGRAMLGDTGANALGALLGTAAVERLPRPARWAALSGLVALTLASERVSFTAVIDRMPVLSALDRWGRRAPAGPGHA